MSADDAGEGLFFAVGAGCCFGFLVGVVFVVLLDVFG